MFIVPLYKRLHPLHIGVGAIVSLLLLLMLPLPVLAGIYDADTPTTYKEYWVAHSEFTGGHETTELPNCVDTNPGGAFYVEPWKPCTKELTFTIPDDFSQARKVEVYLDLWRNRVRQSARFKINNGTTYQPLVGTNWGRTPYVMEIPKSELQTGVNTMTIWGDAGPYHMHDIAFRVYYDDDHPLRDNNGAIITAPTGELLSVWADNGLFAANDGGTLQVDNDLVVLTARVATPAKFIEFHAYYDGYDEDNDGVTLDWHNLGRNDYHPGGRSAQATGGTIDHIGTLLTPTPGHYTIAWRLPHIVNQSGVRFKIRLVDAAGAVQDAAGGISAPFALTRTGAMISFTDPNFSDAVLHHNGDFPDTVSRLVSINVDPADYNQAFLIGAFWETPQIAVNGNNHFKAFAPGEDEWALSIRSLTMNWLSGNTNTIDYFYTNGFGQFIEKPGPMLVLKQRTAQNDTTPPLLTPLSPMAGAIGVEPDKAIILQLADAGTGVDINTVTMRVNGEIVQPTTNGSPDLYTITYTPTVAFAYNALVTVTIDGCDYAGRCINNAGYSFTIRQLMLNTNRVGMGNIQIAPLADQYLPGQVVTLTAAADLGWNFLDWSGTASSTEAALVLEMQQDHVITATFTQDQYQLTLQNAGGGSGVVTVTPDQPTYLYGAVITLTAAADLGSTFGGWSGDVVTPSAVVTMTVTGNHAITATFAQEQYTLHVNTIGDGDGEVAIQPNQATYLYGAVVTLVATPLPGSSFGGWDGDLMVVAPQITVTMTDNVDLTANFVRDYYALTVTVVDDAGTPTTNGTVLPSPPASPRGYLYGETATLRAIAEPGWFFHGWSGSAGGIVPTTTVTFDADEVITATFGPNYYTITAQAVDENGAPLASDLVSISPPNQPLGYLYGETVTVTATAAAGWRFVQWDGALSRGTAVASFAVKENGVAIATFTDKTYSLSATVNEEGTGLIQLNPEPPFSFGQVVTLTVVPTAGWEFTGWTGDLSGTANPATIRLDDHKVVVAMMMRSVYTVQVGLLGGQGAAVGGRVEITPTTGPYYYGDVVTLKALPNTGYRFVRWDLDAVAMRIVPSFANEFDPTKPTIEVAVTASATYLAEFAPIDLQTIFLPFVAAP